MNTIRFKDTSGTFSIKNPGNYSGLYFPIASEKGLKCSVTPNLGGDSKLNQESFLLEPVSVENLHNNRSTRNFWCHIEKEGCWSAAGASAEEENNRYTKDQEETELTAGLMWHTVRRTSVKYQLRSEITSFVPVGENAEIMYVKIQNTGSEDKTITPIAAIPIYGRSADNIRDHRNVTSMLHRIQTVEYGVCVKPTMSFDEKGHRENHKIYFAAGAEGDGSAPAAFYHTVESFIGEGGTFTHPEAVYMNHPGVLKGTKTDGKEAMGGIRFETIDLKAGESREYVIFLGVSEDENCTEQIISQYGSSEKVKKVLEDTKEYWQKKVNVFYHTGDKEFDNFMRWTSFQPILRRIYGCSFLPHHDYGRGGRGWRDLWQDCLSLLLMDPSGVRSMILENYGGVRVDGTNATIIGHKPGDFIADRNGISRVWMDHAVWPFITTKLYIDQTGDVEILQERSAYFKDSQSMRGRDTDDEWKDGYGTCQKAEDGSVYKGTILEHLLIEHLCAFFEVGDHNIMLLRGADWNDALDMAADHGESVAFTSAYAGNLRDLAKAIALLKDRTSCKEISLMKELGILLKDDRTIYADIQGKKKILETYLDACRHSISGEVMYISVDELIENLNEKADWLMSHIREQEWISGEDKEGWFNSYYDNHKQAVEGFFEDGVRMMLTGQVFAIMSGTATEEQIESICKSADHYLYSPKVGGYRLNTDFHELKFDMGRMFGFAYGEKENGAVFSHMTVMYANALYKRGFVKEGHRALQTLADTALNFETSKIYPGIPEYFNSQGRGMYHYLTGAASWYMLTMITEVFGVKGGAGDLTILPKLMKDQFDNEGMASLGLNFRGKELKITYLNEDKLEYGDYKISQAECDGVPMEIKEGRVIMSRSAVDALSDKIHKIRVVLAAKAE